MELHVRALLAASAMLLLGCGTSFGQLAVPSLNSPAGTDIAARNTWRDITCWSSRYSVRRNFAFAQRTQSNAI
jgi:hypothetical protein